MTVDCSKIVAVDASPNSLLGYSVALDDGTALVGQATEGKVYVFVRSGGAWLQQAELTHGASGFGNGAVAIHGNTAVVSALGSAHVFTRSGVNWSPQAILTNSDSESGDRFANSLAIDEDTVVVGSPASFTGGAYVFVRSGSTWEEQAKLKASDGHQANSFGVSVAVQGDIAMVGAWQDGEHGTEAGAVYAFTRAGVDWTQQQKLVPDPPKQSEEFGVGVALSGATVLIGAEGASEHGPDSGASYVFVLGGSGWEQQAKLVPPDGVANNIFGHMVDLDGDTAIIAATNLVPGMSGGSTTETYVYIYERDETDWAFVEKLIGSGQRDLFHNRVFVGVSGCSVLLGNPLDDELGFHAGAATACLLENCPCEQPVPGMVGWWTLDQEAPPAKDSARDNDGVWVNNPTPTQGIVDRALFFKANQSVEITHDPTFDFGADESFTIDAWVQPSTHFPLSSIVDKRDHDSGVGFAVRLVNGLLTIIVADGNNTVSFQDTTALLLNEWSFVAVTVNRDSDIGNVYVNGASVGSFVPSVTASGSINTLQPLIIASSGDPSDRYIGKIDEVEVFDRALDPSEIVVLYKTLSGGKCKPCIDPPPGLVAWWPFDDLPGAGLSDIVGPNDGIGIGDPEHAAGRVAESLAFNGINQRVEIPDHSSLNFDESSSFSIDVWIRADVLDNLFCVIVEKWDPERRIGYQLFMRSGRVIFNMNDGSTSLLSYVSTRKVQVGRWYFVAVTVDRVNDIGTVYILPSVPNDPIVDGTFVPSINAPSDISHPLAMNIGGNVSGQNFPGRIDELEIYRRALEHTEISELWIAETAGKCKPAGDASPSGELSTTYR